jgi:hypothetical protein
MSLIYITTLLATSLTWIPVHEASVEDNVLIPYLWRNIEFVFPTDADRNNALQDGSYVIDNAVLNDVDVWEDPVRGQQTGGYRIFISTPRVRQGIPVTLSTVTSIKSGNSFLLAAFPNLQSQAPIPNQQNQQNQQQSQNCDGLVTVDKMHIDRCGLLWVLDTGRINEFGTPSRICQPKLLIYNLADNDVLLDRYEFPDGVVTAASSLTTTVTDSRSDNCRDSVAYIADLNASGLVVFDLVRRTSWRITHNFFYPYPRHGTFTISGTSFDLMDGVFGMSLGPLRNGDRMLYFHSLASLRQSWVPTSVLRNEQLIAQRDQFRTYFSVSGEFREGQCSLEVMTDDGIMIYNDLRLNALMCWNTATAPIKENTQLIYQDHTSLQFISGMKLKGDKLWIASNQVQNLMANVTTIDARYRIVFIKSVRLLLKEKGYKCLNPVGDIKGHPVLPMGGSIKPPVLPGSGGIKPPPFKPPTFQPVKIPHNQHY